MRAARLPVVDARHELPVDADPPERRREAAPIGLALARIMQRLRLSDAAWIESLRQAWPEIAGPELAPLVRPGKETGGVLYLYVRDSPTLFDVRRLHLRPLEARIRRHPGGNRLRQVRLQLDPDPPPSP